MQEIQASLSALKLGAPQVFRNLALYPLVSEADARAGYVLLEEALERRLARVTEAAACPSSPSRIPRPRRSCWWMATSSSARSRTGCSTSPSSSRAGLAW